MKKKVVVFFLIMMVLCRSSMAVTNQKVQIDQLQLLEEKDDFPIKAIYEGIRVGASDSISKAFGQEDVLALRIVNNGDEPAYLVKIYVIAYDEDSNKVEMGVVASSDASVSVITMKENQVVLPKESCKLSIAIRGDNIKGVHMFVDSFEDENGQEIKNPLSQDWLDNVFESNRIKLD